MHPTLYNACWHYGVFLLAFFYGSRFLNENYLGLYPGLSGHRVIFLSRFGPSLFRILKRINVNFRHSEEIVGQLELLQMLLHTLRTVLAGNLD